MSVAQTEVDVLARDQCEQTPVPAIVRDVGNSAHNAQLPDRSTAGRP